MKPSLPLTELEREPLVHFGCTWTEIKRCVRQSAAVTLPLTLLVMFTVPGMAILGMIPGLLIWLGLSYLMTRHIQKYRAGKPLYYERHRQKVRSPSAPFVRAGVVYQADRSTLTPRS